MLRSMQPGAACYDKIWGAGRIREISEYHQQVEIDFVRQAGPPSRAGGCQRRNLLLPLPESIWHAAWPTSAGSGNGGQAETPAEVVWEVLLTFGPFTLFRPPAGAG